MTVLNFIANKKLITTYKYSLCSEIYFPDTNICKGDKIKDISFLRCVINSSTPRHDKVYEYSQGLWGLQKEVQLD